ncbi:MAG: GNAT family N-acetyltransferase [Chloroflexota bacterium]|nr:GNAT family N-acetyltransferase [Chloroflexota bacterium]
MRLIRLGWPPDAATAAAWEGLRVAAPTEAVFLTPEWLGAWWRHLGPEGRRSGFRGRTPGSAAGPLLFAMMEGRKPRGLAPLYRAPLGSTGLRALRLLGTGVSDYLDLLLAPEPAPRTAALRTLMEGLVKRQAGWDALDLRGLPAESPTVPELARLAGELGLPCAIRPGYARPAIALDGTFEGFLKSKPGRFRYNLRSRLKRLGQVGEVRFRTVACPADVPAALDALVDLHARRWSGQHTATIFSSSERGRRFYADACRRYAARGLLDLTLLEAGDRVVAGSLSFVDRDTWYYYLPAWDPDLAALAPSSLLLAHLVEAAYARGLRRFDFMLGEESYKARWATEERRTVNLVVGGPGVRGRAAFAALTMRLRARDRARRSPFLQRARRYGLGRAKALLQYAGRAAGV